MHFSELTAAQWALAAGGAFFIGFAKSGIPGFGLLFVALFASAFPARASVGLVLPMLLFGDVLAILQYRRHAQWPVLLGLLPWTVGGIVIGWWAIKRVDDTGMRIAIGSILLGLIVLHYVRRAWTRVRTRGAGVASGGAVAGAVAGGGGGGEARADPDLPPRRVWEEALAGTAAGFATMMANAAGPITILYFLARRLPSFAFLGTSAWFFFLVNALKVPFAIEAGIITTGSISINAALAVVVVAGALFGRAVVQRINQRWFEISALSLTAIASAKLLWDGLAAR